MLHNAPRPLKRSWRLAEMEDDHDSSRTSPNHKQPGYPERPSRKRSRRDFIDAHRWATWSTTSGTSVYPEDTRRFMMDVDDSDYEMAIVAEPLCTPNSSCLDRETLEYLVQHPAPSDAAATKTQNSDSGISLSKFNMLPLLFPRGRFIRRRISASFCPMDRHDEIDSEEGD